MNIPFNKPYLTGKESGYIQDVLRSGKFSGNGAYTARCQRFFEERYGFGKCLLTTSCTDALEMAAILAGIRPGDEVIMPSYTFVSTANAFVLRGAHIVFADSGARHPNLDADTIEPLITPKTRAIVVVHYAGAACDMDTVMEIAGRYGLYVVEDAALALDAFYTGRDGRKRALGSIGHLAAFSFHETKNVISGEGGLLAVNDPALWERAEKVWEKGTDRSAFFRGEVDKYGWVDVGSSFLPAETVAAFLWAQLEELDHIQALRRAHWETYAAALAGLPRERGVELPYIPPGAGHNAHIFYLVCGSPGQRSALIAALKRQGIGTAFHYQGLHDSPFYQSRHDGRELPNCVRYTERLLRLPLYPELDPRPVIDALLGFDG